MQSGSTTARRAARTRRALLAVLTAFALAVAGAMTAAPAHAAPGVVNGTVTLNGAPVASGYVYLVTPGGGSTQTTISAGSFAYPSVAPGRYTLRFDVPDVPRQYLGGVADRHSADWFDVGDGATVSETAALVPGVELSGAVVTPGGDPVDTYVEVYEVYPDGDWGYRDYVSTDALGRFSFVLLPGRYALWVEGDGPYIDQYYGDVADFDDAKVVTLGASPVTGLTVTLPRGAVVTGTVTGADGAPISGGYVTAYRVRTDPWGHVDVEDYGGDTISGGSYEIGWLPGGSYLLRVEPYDAVHPAQWLGGSFYPGGSEQLVLKRSETKRVDVRLSRTPFVAPAKVAVSVPRTSRLGKSARATVSVTAVKGTPTGTVTLRDGSRSLGTKQVVNGKATFDLPKKLAVGAHRLQASFAGMGDVAPGTSAPATLHVLKAKATVKAAFQKKKSRLKVTVKAAVKAGGKVVLRQGKQKLATKKLKKSRATFPLSRLGSGKATLRVGYNGSKNVAKATKKVTVRLA